MKYLKAFESYDFGNPQDYHKHLLRLKSDPEYKENWKKKTRQRSKTMVV